MKTQAVKTQTSKPDLELETIAARHSSIENFYHQSRCVDILSLGTYTRELVQQIAQILPDLDHLESVSYRTYQGGHCRMIFRGLFYEGMLRISVLLNADFKREQASMTQIAEDPFAFFGISKNPMNDCEQFLVDLGGGLDQLRYNVYGGKRDRRSATVFYRRHGTGQVGRGADLSIQDVAITMASVDPNVLLFMS